MGLLGDVTGLSPRMRWVTGFGIWDGLPGWGFRELLLV